MNESIEKTVRYVDASFAIEGMPLTEKDKDSLRDCLSGKENVDSAVQKIIDEYKVVS